MSRLILAICLLFAAPAQADLLGDDFWSIKSVTNEILERWPSDEYIYVGLGRSPVAVMALLERLGHGVFHLPLSKQSEWEYPYLEHYLDEFMLSAVEDSPKKLLFVDYLAVGSFKHLDDLLERYFNYRPKLRGRYDYALMSLPMRQFDNAFWFRPGHWINLAKHQFPVNPYESFRMKLFKESYHSMSPYLNSHFPVDSVQLAAWKNFEPNPVYEQLKAEVLNKYPKRFVDRTLWSRLKYYCEYLFFAEEAI